MRDAFLLSDSPSLTIDKLVERLEGFSAADDLDAELFQRGRDSTFLEISHDDSVQEYYEDTDIEALERLGINRKSLKVFPIRFRDYSVVPQALASLLNVPRLWLDNDHGMIVPISRFLYRVADEPNWNWAISSD